MNQTLDLAWDTYYFYTNELSRCEDAHLQVLQTLKNFLDKNPNPYKYQRKRIKHKCRESCYQLHNLYKKQIDSISDLIDIYSHYVDIPPEREVDLQSLITLKNVSFTLLLQVTNYKEEIELMLND